MLTKNNLFGTRIGRDEFLKTKQKLEEERKKRKDLDENAFEMLLYRYELSNLVFKKKVCLILGIILFLVGLFLTLNSQAKVIGAVIGISVPDEISILGFLLIALSCILLLAVKGDLEKRLKITSHVDKDPAIVRYAIEATRNQAIQREMNHLQVELSKGNLEAGLGGPGHVKKIRRKGGFLGHQKKPEKAIHLLGSSMELSGFF